MSPFEVAALVAAASFALLACAGAYLAIRFTKVLGDASTLVRETRAQQQALFTRANAAVDRARAQLDATEAATAAVADLGDSMTELAGQASALAGIARPSRARWSAARSARPPPSPPGSGTRWGCAAGRLPAPARCPERW